MANLRHNRYKQVGISNGAGITGQNTTSATDSPRPAPFGHNHAENVACELCEQARARHMLVTLKAETPFREASRIWLEARQFGQIKSKFRYLASETLRNYQTYVNALNKFFGPFPLREIHLGHIDNYRKFRMDDAGPNKIKQEEDLLIAVLKRAGCWTDELEENYERLQHVESDIPHALTPQQMEHWFHVTREKEDWLPVHWYSILSIRCALSNCEMRGLKRHDINLYAQTLTIQARHAKRSSRIRTVPMAPDAIHAAEHLLQRAESLGSKLPEHFLFPICISNIYRPEIPMSASGLRIEWNQARDKAGFPNWTFHDCRHTGITRWAEAGVPIAVIKSMAGHMSVRMTEHYTQISDQAKRKAIQAVYEGNIYDIGAVTRRGNVRKRKRA